MVQNAPLTSVMWPSAAFMVPTRCSVASLRLTVPTCWDVPEPSRYLLTRRNDIAKRISENGDSVSDIGGGRGGGLGSVVDGHTAIPWKY